MTKAEIAQHNEALAVQNIRIAYINGGLVDAMALCQDYMGVNTKEAFARVNKLCEDLRGKDGTGNA